MESRTESIRMHCLVVLYDLQTEFYKSAIDGISAQDALERLNTKANHVAWLAGSIVQERYEMIKILGKDVVSSSEELFANHQGIKVDAFYPSLQTYLADWNKITPLLRSELVAVTDKKLDEVLTYPEMSFSIYEMLSFDIYREANCIGQIALWRRLLGYEPINYM